jgi:hypothetical protein
MTNKHVMRLYFALIQSVKTDEFYTSIDLSNRVNLYRCKNGHEVKTKDIDPGVTPFIIPCPICHVDAYSSGYRDKAARLKVTHVWFRPSLAALSKLNKTHKMVVEHVLNGGLIYRKLKKGENYD